MSYDGGSIFYIEDRTREKTSETSFGHDKVHSSVTSPIVPFLDFGGGCRYKY